MNILRPILGLLLIPLCLGLARTVLFLVASLGAAPSASSSLPALALGGGVLLWAVLFTLLPRPVRSYVLAHELTHALWGALAGARVSGLKVSASGGSVRVSEVNWLTALAPYFFPFYTAAAALLYGLLALFLDLRAWELAWLGLIGLTLGFHWTFTLAALAQAQADIRPYGRLFAYPLICFFNLLAVALVLALVSPVTLEQAGARLAGDTARVVQGCGRAGAALFQWLGQNVGAGGAD